MSSDNRIPVAAADDDDGDEYDDDDEEEDDNDDDGDDNTRQLLHSHLHERKNGVQFAWNACHACRGGIR